jgi:excisionase family DNA binding protein
MSTTISTKTLMARLPKSPGHSILRRLAMTEVLTVRESARRLGVHENTVRNWTDQGHLAAMRLPSGVRRIPLAEIERLEREMFAVPSSIPEDPIATKAPDQLEAEEPTKDYPTL